MEVIKVCPLKLLDDLVDVIWGVLTVGAELRLLIEMLTLGVLVGEMSDAPAAPPPRPKALSEADTQSRSEQPYE